MSCQQMIGKGLARVGATSTSPSNYDENYTHSTTGVPFLLQCFIGGTLMGAVRVVLVKGGGGATLQVEL